MDVSACMHAASFSKNDALIVICPCFPSGIASQETTKKEMKREKRKKFDAVSEYLILQSFLTLILIIVYLIKDLKIKRLKISDSLEYARKSQNALYLINAYVKLHKLGQENWHERKEFRSRAATKDMAAYAPNGNGALCPSTLKTKP